MSHNWSPIVLPAGSSGAGYVLVDTTQHLTSVSVSAGSPTTATAGAGTTMDALTSTLAAAGYGFCAIPAPGDITVGGALAINAHGSAIPGSGETMLAGQTYGSLSNLILSLTAVVWDASAGQYRLKTFQRTDRTSAPSWPTWAARSSPRLPCSSPRRRTCAARAGSTSRPPACSPRRPAPVPGRSPATPPGPGGWRRSGADPVLGAAATRPSRVGHRGLAGHGHAAGDPRLLPVLRRPGVLDLEPLHRQLRVRPAGMVEGLGCTSAAPWTSTGILGSTIPAAVSAGQASGDGWSTAISILSSCDPHAVFSNSFLDQLLR